MTGTAEYYQSVLEDSGTDSESLTWLVVTGTTREEVADALSVDLAAPSESWVEDGAAWSLAELPGGVLALEHSGYADPTNDSLVALLRGGRSVAVARSNVQAHERFGCARDGELVFDDDEFGFIDAPSTVPDVLRPLFDQNWETPTLTRTTTRSGPTSWWPWRCARCGLAWRSRPRTSAR